VYLTEGVELAPAVALRAAQPMTTPKRSTRAADAELLVRATEARSRRSAALDALRDMSSRFVSPHSAWQFETQEPGSQTREPGSVLHRNLVRSSTRFLGFSEDTRVRR
jgi:hypothetical protein